ncbi:MAG: hypothetical protein SGJ09_13660 [Phycisphaerae bacterium]|nr:hypothetical protein [Phycisphaerae bacterium]
MSWLRSSSFAWDVDTVLMVIAWCFASTFGLGLSIAALAARAAWRGRLALGPPRCRTCGSMLRGAGEALRARCQECGVAIDGTSGMQYATWRRSTPHALAMLVVVALALGAVWIGRVVIPRSAFSLSGAVQEPYAHSMWPREMIASEGTGPEASAAVDDIFQRTFSHPDESADELMP